MPAKPLTVQDTMRTLAAAGVATVADENSRTPLQPVTGSTVLTLTAWQVRTLTTEAAAHGGIFGADLDRVIPTNGGPPLAFLIGGWIANRGDSTAVAAGGLTGAPDWFHAENVVFPLVVIDLFVADALEHASAVTLTGASAVASSVTNATTASYRQVDVTLNTGCSGIASFVDGVLSSIFGALKVNPADVSDWISGKLGGGAVAQVVGAVGGFFASFWNKAVDFAEMTVRNVLTALTAPILNTLRSVIGALETITIALSYLRRWTAPITPDPASNSFSVSGQSAHRGSFSVTIDKHSESADWPALLTDCAATLGNPVPTLSKEGSAVTWTEVGQENGLVGVDRPTGPPYVGGLDASLSDRLDYTAGTEDRATAKGALVTPTITVAAHVRRTEIDQLADLLTDYLAKNFPPIIQPTIRAILGSVFGWAKHALDEFTAVDGSATIQISHHVPRPPSSSPSPASCSASGSAIPAGTYAGSIRAVLTASMNLSTGGGTTSNAGGSTLPLTGTVKLTSNGKTVTGTMSLSGSGTSEVGPSGGVTVHSTDDGTLVATISGPVGSPVVDGTLGGSWASLDAPVIQGNGGSTAPIHAGLHVTHADCSGVTGDVIAMFREFAAPVSQYLTLGGSGTWTAPRT